MAFKPLHDRVLVRRVESEEKTKGGLIIPDSAKEKPSEGEVVACGDGARDYIHTLRSPASTSTCRVLSVVLVLRSPRASGHVRPRRVVARASCGRVTVVLLVLRCSCVQ